MYQGLAFFDSVEGGLMKNTNMMRLRSLSSADEILTSLESVYGDMGEAAVINPTVDGELEFADLRKLRGVAETLTERCTPSGLSE